MPVDGGPPVLLFLHIPKTAGTTFDAILDRNYPSRRVADVYPGFGFAPGEFLGLPAERTRRYAVIRGHFCYGIHSVLDRPYAYATFLRDPDRQVLSRYRHARSRFHPLSWLARRGLAEFLRRSPDNYQTRMLIEPRPAIGGEHPPLTDADLAEARANLEKFALVGITELFDESLLLAGDRLGLTRLCYARHNVRRGGDAATPSPEIAALLESHGRHDRELHRWARSRLEERIDAEGDAFAERLAAFRRSNARYASRRGLLDRMISRARKARRYVASRVRRRSSSTTMRL